MIKMRRRWICDVWLVMSFVFVLTTMSSPLNPGENYRLIDIRNYYSGEGELAAFEKAIDGPLTEDWKKPARVRLQVPMENVEQLILEAETSFIDQSFETTGAYLLQLLEVGVTWNPVLKGRLALCTVVVNSSPDALLAAWAFAKESLEQYPRDYAAFLAMAIIKFWTLQFDQAHQWLRLSKLCKNAPEVLLKTIETRFKIMSTDTNSPMHIFLALKSLKVDRDEFSETDWDAYTDTVQGISNMEALAAKLQEDENFWQVAISRFEQLSHHGVAMSLAADAQEESPFGKISTSVMKAMGDHLDLTSITNLGTTCKRLTHLIRRSGASRAAVAQVLGVPKENIPPQQGILNLFGKIKAIEEVVKLLMSNLPKDPVEAEKLLTAAELKLARFLDQGVNFLGKTKSSLFSAVLGVIHELLMADLGTKSANKVIHLLEAKFSVLKFIEVVWAQLPESMSPFAVLADLISYEGETGDRFLEQVIAAGYVSAATSHITVIDQHSAGFHALVAARREIQKSSFMRFPHWELTFEVPQDEILSSTIIEDEDEVDEAEDAKDEEGETAEVNGNEDGEIEEIETAQQKRDMKRAQAILTKMREVEMANFSGVWHFVAHTYSIPDAGVYERGVMKLTHTELSEEEAAENEELMSLFGKFVGIAQSTFLTMDGLKSVGDLKVSMRRAQFDGDSSSLALEFYSPQSSIRYSGRLKIHGHGLIIGNLVVFDGDEHDMNDALWEDEPAYSFVAWRDADVATLQNEQDLSYKRVFEATRSTLKQVAKKNLEILEYSISQLDNADVRNQVPLLIACVNGLRQLLRWTPYAPKLVASMKEQLAAISEAPATGEIRKIARGSSETDAEFKERTLVFNSVLHFVGILRQTLCYDLLTPYDTKLAMALAEHQKLSPSETERFLVRWTLIARMAPFSVSKPGNIPELATDLLMRLVEKSEESGNEEIGDDSHDSSGDRFDLLKINKAKKQKMKANNLSLAGSIAIAGAIVAAVSVGAYMLGRWLSKPKNNPQ